MPEPSGKDFAKVVSDLGGDVAGRYRTSMLGRGMITPLFLIARAILMSNVLPRMLIRQPMHIENTSRSIPKESLVIGARKLNP